MNIKWKLIEIIRSLPLPIRDVVYKVATVFVKKHNAELEFWKSRWELDSNVFENDFYEKLMLYLFSVN